MVLSVISIAFLFLVRMLFASVLSAIQKIRICYGNDTVKLVRQLDKLTYKYHRLLVELFSIENCVKDNYTPKFAQFRLGECRSARFICIPKMSTDTTYARHYDQEKKCVIDQEYTYLQIQMG